MEYAVRDVTFLLLLHQQLCTALGDPTGGRVLKRSRLYSEEYPRLNLHFGSAGALEKRGARVQAMLATRTEAALHFKLNLSGQQQGVVSRPEALTRFHSVKLGEVVDCYIAAWNT